MKELEEVMKSIPDAADIHCQKHPQISSYLTCSRCGSGICPDCLGKSQENWRMTCPRCRLKQSMRVDPMKLVRAFKYPFAWVSLCLLVACIAYSQGFGNPSMARYIKEDAKLPWFRQRAGSLYISQAAREKERAYFLIGENRVSESEKWFSLSSRSFGLALQAWPDTPVTADIKIAQADMLAKSGKPSEALKLLEKLEIPPGSELYSAWQYQTGLVCEQIKDKNNAEIHFRASLKSFKQKKDFVDSLISAYESDQRDNQMRRFVSRICGTEISYGQIAEKCGMKSKDAGTKKAEFEENIYLEKNNEGEECGKDFDIEIIEKKKELD